MAGWSTELGISLPPEQFETSNTNALLPTPLPSRQQKGMVRNHALHIFTTVSLLTNFIFLITLLQGGPNNWGYLHPQNGLEASITIVLLLTIIQSALLKDTVRNHALHIFRTVFLLMNFYFFNYIISGWSVQQGYLCPHNELAPGNKNSLLPMTIPSRQ